MKKTLTTIITSALALVLVSTSVNAQTLAVSKSINKEVTTHPEEAEARVVEAPASAISAKVVNAFSKSFTGVTPKWYMVGDNFLARFTGNGTVTHSLYKKNGYQLYSVTKGTASLLPATVADLIMETYPDFEISAATKATSLGTTAWIADLKLGKSLIIVKVIDNEIVESTRYRTNVK